jgi:hypothetical protein
MYEGPGQPRQDTKKDKKEVVDVERLVIEIYKDGLNETTRERKRERERKTINSKRR